MKQLNYQSQITCCASCVSKTILVRVLPSLSTHSRPIIIDHFRQHSWKGIKQPKQSIFVFTSVALLTLRVLVHPFPIEIMDN